MRWQNASLALGRRWWFWAPYCVFWELKVREHFGLKTRGGGSSAFPIL